MRITHTRVWPAPFFAGVRVGELRRHKRQRVKQRLDHGKKRTEPKQKMPASFHAKPVHAVGHRRDIPGRRKRGGRCRRVRARKAPEHRAAQLHQERVDSVPKGRPVRKLARRPIPCPSQEVSVLRAADLETEEQESQRSLRIGVPNRHVSPYLE